MPFRAFIAVLLALPSAALASPCAVDVPAAVFTAEVEAAERAFAALDGVAFLQRAADVQHDLPCVDAPLDPAWVARIHRTRAIELYTQRREDEAAGALAAMRLVDPSLSLAGLVPDGHPLWALSGRSPPRDTPVTLEAPAEGDVQIDGQTSLIRPTERPFVFQIVLADRAALTAWVPARGPVPAYRVAEPPLPVEWIDLSAQLASPRRHRAAGVATLASGVAAVITGGVLLGASVAARDDLFDDHPGWTEADVLARQQQTNTRTVIGSVLLGLGAGAVAVGATVGW